MPEESLGDCTSCGRAGTSMRCSGCMDAPEYQPGDAACVRYCDSECQKEHWPDHRALCRAMRQRKALLRAASILKIAFLTYREIVCDLEIINIEFYDGILRLYRSPLTFPRRWIFPSHLTTNPEHKAAAITFNQCMTAVALLGPMTRKLPSGMPAVIEVIFLDIGKRRVPTIVIPSLDDGHPPHSVLRVKLPFSGEDWIIDTTGSQYGFRDALVPYHRYISDNECKMVGPPTPCAMTETEFLDYLSTIPFLNSSEEQRMDGILERQAHLLFAAFVEARVDKDMLKVSATEIKDSTERFADGLRSHMMTFYQ